MGGSTLQPPPKDSDQGVVLNISANSDLVDFELMLRARRFNEKLLDLAPLVVGPLISSIGYEATAATVAANAAAEDRVLLSHRNHHFLAAFASDLSHVFAELFVRDLSPQRGRGGGMHLAAPPDRVLWSSAVIAGHVPLSVGVAVAAQRRGRGVAFCAFGDGAMGEGVVSECLNFASLNKLPLVFVCENNTPTPASGDVYTTAPVETMEHAAHRLIDVAEAYQVKSIRVSASDPASLRAVVSAATSAARAGDGPQFVEVMTEPWPAEMDGLIPTKPSGDTSLAAAVATPTSGSWGSKDPVLARARELLASGVELAMLEKLDADVQREVDEAAERAEQAPLPPISVAADDIWAPHHGLSRGRQ